mmetsp:Transcript_142759/g.248978  ORF Transcript_142759/g.248978 Transcript_142759/m.248978 type:complete len:116 (+) Transcript_142759:537-884(+)
MQPRKGDPGQREEREGVGLSSLAPDTTTPTLTPPVPSAAPEPDASPSPSHFLTDPFGPVRLPCSALQNHMAGAPPPTTKGQGVGFTRPHARKHTHTQTHEYTHTGTHALEHMRVP